MSKILKKVSYAAFIAVLAVGVVVPGGAAQAQLTESQIQSILDFLKSFDVDATTVSNVEGALRGEATPGTDGGGAITGIPEGFTFDQNLQQGDSSTDVRYLQILLNSDADTQVADSGPGSSGNETNFFGPLTRSGVVRFQDKYADEVLAPWGLSSGTGFVGSTTRSKANELLAAAPAAPPEEEEEEEEEPPAPGTVSVSLSGPASTTFVAGQATANVGNFVLSGSGTVTNVTLKRTGVSADATLSNVYLFDGATRLTDPASVSSGTVTFNNPNGLFSVSGSRTISVKSDIASGTSGETVGVDLTGVTLSSGTVSGLPVSSNLHTIASATLAGVAVGTTVPSSASTTDPGDGVRVWENPVTISNREVSMERMALQQIGSINAADIGNFRLLIDGSQVAQVNSLDANRFVTFDLTANPKTLSTGTRTLRVLADVTGGSSRTIQMSLRRAADLTVVDSQFGVPVTATGTFAASTGEITVNSGTMTVAKTSDSPAGNITDSASDVVLARYTFTAYGEAIKVDTLNATFDASDNLITQLRNGRILVNGAQVGSTASLNEVDDTATGTQFTTNFVVNPGSPATVEVRADIFDDDGTNSVASGDTITARLLTGSSNATRQVSLGTINVPSSDTDGNQLTVSTGSISLQQASNYGNQTTVAPQTAYKLGSFVLVGNSTEVVNINTFEIDFTGTGAFDASDDLTDVFIMYGSNQSTVKGTVTDSDNTWSVDTQLAKNGSLTMDVFATIGSNVGTDTMRVDLTVTGVTADSATTVYADVDSSNSTKDAGFQGQVITAGTGVIAASLNSASSPVSAIVDDEQTIATAVFNFTSSNDSYTITDVTVTLGNASAVNNVVLKNGLTGAQLATKPASTSMTFNDIALPVGADDTNAIVVELELGSVDVGTGTTGSSIQTTLNTATAANSQGVESTVSSVPVTANALYVYQAVPEIALTALPTSTLTPNSEVVMSKFTVTSNGGTIEWKDALFTVSKTASVGIIVTQGDLKLYDVTSGSREEVPGTFTVATLGDGNTSGTVKFVATTAEQLSSISGSSKTYELVETNGSAVTANGSMSTRITQPSSFAASVAYASVAGSPSFVWSDTSAGLHSETTTDWTNDFKVKGLPTTTQTVSITTF